MQVAPHFTLLTLSTLLTLLSLLSLFLLFRLIYTAFSSMHAYIYIVEKVKTLLEGAEGLLNKMWDWVSGVDG